MAPTMLITDLPSLAEKLRMLAQVCDDNEVDLIEMEAELHYLGDQVGDWIEEYMKK